jgi:hypothetical protein
MLRMPLSLSVQRLDLNALGHCGEHVIASLRFGVNDNRTRAHSRIRRGSRVAARVASWLVVPSRRTFRVVPRR